MATIEQSIDVDAPISATYDQWTRFEEFPQFMEGVDEVRQLDDRRLHWKASFGGSTHEWDAEITEQQPDVAKDLERFKELLESRGGQESGAWRGEVPREG